jgi:hypothetical protein
MTVKVGINGFGRIGRSSIPPYPRRRRIGSCCYQRLDRR